MVRGTLSSPAWPPTRDVCRFRHAGERRQLSISQSVVADPPGRASALRHGPYAVLELQYERATAHAHRCQQLAVEIESCRCAASVHRAWFTTRQTRHLCIGNRRRIKVGDLSWRGRIADIEHPNT